MLFSGDLSKNEAEPIYGIGGNCFISTLLYRQFFCSYLYERSQRIVCMRYIYIVACVKLIPTLIM